MSKKKQGTKPRYASDFMRGIHEAAKGLHEIGAISDSRMRDFDRNCTLNLNQPRPSKGGR